MARLNYRVHLISEWDGGATSAGVTSRSMTLQVFSNFIGTPQWRVYADGGTPGAFTTLPIVSGIRQATFFPAIITTPRDIEGTYVIDFQDDNGIRTLGKFTFFAWSDGLCWDEHLGSGLNETGCRTYIHVTDNGISISNQILVSSTDSSEASAAHAYANISVDGGSTYKTTFPNGMAFGFGSNSRVHTSEWSNSELSSLGISGLSGDIRVNRISPACTTTAVRATDLLVDEVTFPPLEVDYTFTNPTQNGVSDGTITLIPSGGSGLYSYLWADGPTTQNRSNLFGGAYTVTVTDFITEDVVTVDIFLTEPQAPNEASTVFQVPLLNSLHFVIQETQNGCDVLQTPDNTLLRNQEFPGYTQVNYFQKVAKCDIFPIQFNSDFSTFIVNLIDYCTGETVKQFTPELKQDNIGIVEDYSITIRNHTGFPGKSRVYFNVGTPPIPLSVGDVFEVLDNADGLDGGYVITDILTDSSLGYQYLVINRNYDAPGATSAATGRFTIDNEDFNVYEVTFSFADVSNGLYYAEIIAINGDTQIVATSEPLDLQTEHKNTSLIEATNSDNAFDVTFTTGFTVVLRVESTLFKRSPGGERSTSRNSDFSLTKINAKKTRVFTFETWALPMYLHEKLSVIFDLDEWYINKVQYQASEGYDEPDFIDRYPLANSSIKIEQSQWFRKYNSDDIGSVNDGGFLSTGNGFLRV